MERTGKIPRRTWCRNCKALYLKRGSTTFNRRSWFVWFANCYVLDLRSFVSQAKNGLAMALNEEDPKDAATGMVPKLQGIVSEGRLTMLNRTSW